MGILFVDARGARRRLLAQVLFALCAPASALAQEQEPVPVVPVQTAESQGEAEPPTNSEDDELLTVIVTANKRRQDIRDVAGSVSALTGETLEKMGAQSMKDYLKMVPGVTLNQSSAPDYSAPVIRGIATDTLPGLGAKTVGIFVDEVPLSNLFRISAVFDLYPFDLERVEVLKGPQGTLFGSSAIAGALRYITNKPKLDTWEGKLLGSYTRITEGGSKPVVAGMLNVPIGDNAALRVVGQTVQSPGYIDDLNRGIKDTGASEKSGYRVLGSWQPLEPLQLTAMLVQQRSAVDAYGFADQRERLENSAINGDSFQTNTTTVGNLVATYDFGWGQALSATSYSNKFLDFLDSTDRKTGGEPGRGTDGIGPEDQPNSLIQNFGTSEGDSISQELRLTSPDDSGPWQWQVGAAAFRNKQLIDGTSPTPLVYPFVDNAVPLPPTPAIPTPAGTFYGRDNAQILTLLFDAVGTETAVFGEISRKFGERWEVLLGGRLFRTKMVVDTVLGGATVVALSEGQLENRQHGEVKESGFNPKVSVRFTWTPNIDFYGLVAKGFQFGGVQFVPPSTGFEALAESDRASFEPYRSSSLWNYEIGMRTEWWNRKLQFDATFFYMDWTDLQLDRVVQAQGLNTFVIITNLGKAISQGVELAMRVAPVRGLSFFTTASLIEAVSKTPLETNGSDIPANTQLPGSSRFQMANTLSYDLPLSFLGNWSAGLSLLHSHTGRVFNDLEHSAEYGSYDLFDAGLRLASTSLRFQPELSFTVSNLFNTRGVGGIETFNGARYTDIYFVQPRTGILSLTCSF